VLYLAVRRYNYWAECFPLLALRPQATPVAEKARAAMAAVIPAIHAGTPAHEIEALIAASIAPYAAHPLTARACAQRMGIALHEPLHSDIGATYEDGEVYSMRVGGADSAGQYGICSQMISVSEGCNEVLSSADV
jgi:hypothetical protein